MSQRINARVIAAILGAVSIVGCGQAPLSPTAPAAALGSAAASGQVGALSGTYELGFLKEAPGGLQPIEGTLNVGEYLVLKASVRDGAGLLATKGSVTFEYCSAKGVPAPKASCESGSGSWKHHMSMRLDPSGFPPLSGWGACSTARSIGFRFRYASQGSSVPSGTSAARDATWVNAS